MMGFDPALANVRDFIDHLARNEVWRAVTDSPSYEVSSFGNVRRKAGGHLSRCLTVYGYYQVSLSEGGIVRSARVNGLVARAFLGEPPFKGAMVAHNDGSRTNDNVGNLRWASALENQRDRNRHGQSMVGSASANAALTEAEASEIIARLHAGEKGRDLAREYEITASTISNIRLGKTWPHLPRPMYAPKNHAGPPNAAVATDLAKVRGVMEGMR